MVTNHKGIWKNKAFTGTPLTVKERQSDQTIAIYQVAKEHAIQLKLTEPARVKLSLYDLLGKEVADHETSSELTATIWILPPHLKGFYLCKAQAGTQQQTKKIVLR